LPGATERAEAIVHHGLLFPEFGFLHLSCNLRVHRTCEESLYEDADKNPAGESQPPVASKPASGCTPAHRLRTVFNISVRFVRGR
jgi:hypothetical protein